MEVRKVSGKIHVTASAVTRGRILAAFGSDASSGATGLARHGDILIYAGFVATIVVCVLLIAHKCWFLKLAKTGMWVLSRPSEAKGNAHA
jgi:hypothetical protein